MTAPGAKNGPLTQADIQALWEGAMDSSYVQPLEAAGEGQGFEAWTQLFQQLARVSAAADTSSQAMYILPWSGQSGPPAGGAANATVTLTISRGSALVDRVLVFAAGQVVVDEQQTDWGVSPGAEGVVVLTGRQYVLTQTLVLPPGDMGPYTVQAEAVEPGYGYNNPLPGTLVVIDQPGDGYTNTGASMVVPLRSAADPGAVAAIATLVTANAPDMFLPSQLGQYVELTAGSNAGTVARIIGYVAPNPPAQGSGVLLAFDESVEVTGVTGTFQPGEQITFSNGGTMTGVGLLNGLQVGGAGLRLVYELQSGAVPVPTRTVKGLSSAATATVSTVLQGLTYISETGTASWRVLDWADDLSVAVTNTKSPTGGRSAMLDALLAGDRNIPRAAGETDDAYRLRGAQVVDTVSPNAIRRALNRTLGVIPWCFREVGDPTYLPGFYFDHDFYDTHCLLFTTGGLPGPLAVGSPIQWVDTNGFNLAVGWFGGYAPGGQLILVLRMREPARKTLATGDAIINAAAAFSYTPTSILVPTCEEGLRWHLWLDYLDMRAFFMVGLTPGDVGEFGFYYDGIPLQHLGGFYDKGAPSNFYDGYPVGTLASWRAVWQAVERVRAGGVTWQPYVESVGCP